jgi:predicted phage gp36 major capsid-like protein
VYARRRVEVDRRAAQLAAIVRARAQLGHQPRDVVAPRPALFGATRRPTGERGFFCYGRSGAKTVVPEALRYLEVL